MMLYLAQFHLGPLLAALLLGLAMGWIAVVHRGAEMPTRWLVRIGVLVAALVVVSVTQALRGRIYISDSLYLDLSRAAYWLDLALVLFAVYLAGCAVGTWLRMLLVAHQSRPKKPSPNPETDSAKGPAS